MAGDGLLGGPVSLLGGVDACLSLEGRQDAPTPVLAGLGGVHNRVAHGVVYGVHGLAPFVVLARRTVAAWSLLWPSEGRGVAPVTGHRAGDNIRRVEFNHVGWTP